MSNPVPTKRQVEQQLLAIRHYWFAQGRVYEGEVVELGRTELNEILWGIKDNMGPNGMPPRSHF